MKFATKPIQHYPHHLRHVATLPWEIKNSNFLQIFSRCGRKCKQIAFWVHRSFCWLSDEATENIFSVKKTKSVAELREVLKHKISALHASSTVRVCQLLCTALLETFQMKVLTNNPEHRRLMNTRLPWYLTDSPVSAACPLDSGLNR